jgi:hypothetical protein
MLAAAVHTRERSLRLCYRLIVMLSGSANARKFF